MLELSFDFEADGSIKLQQTEDHQWWNTVLLHPCQLRDIAERSGLLASRPAIPEWVAWRLEKLRNRAAALQTAMLKGGLDPDTAADRAEFLADGIGYLLAELTPAADTSGANQPADQSHDFTLEAS
jgi:hypothetical protein